MNWLISSESRLLDFDMLRLKKRDQKAGIFLQRTQ